MDSANHPLLFREGKPVAQPLLPEPEPEPEAPSPAKKRKRGVCVLGGVCVPMYLYQHCALLVCLPGGIWQCTLWCVTL